MKALTIQQPYAYLIVNGHKDIENRDWTTNYRGFILIHAGKKIDPNAFYEDGTFGAYPPGMDTALYDTPLREEYELGGIVGYATLQKVVTSSESPWFRGRYGFVLTQRHTVPFIPLRGQLGLFDVPAEIETQINEIREERYWASEAKEYAKIKQEWYDYRHEGDETPPWGKV